MALNLQKPLVITTTGTKLEMTVMQINFQRKEMLCTLTLFDNKGVAVKNYPLRKTGDDFVKWYNEQYSTHASAVESLSEEIGFVGEAVDEVYN